MDQEADLDGPRRLLPQTSQLQMEVRRDGRTTVVVVTGEIELVATARMREALFAELRLQPDLLVVDLAAVEFFPSTGIATLALLQRAAREADVTLRVVANTRNVLLPLQITQLYEDLLVHSSRAEALAAGTSTSGGVSPSPRI